MRMSKDGLVKRNSILLSAILIVMGLFLFFVFFFILIFARFFFFILLFIACMCAPFVWLSFSFVFSYLGLIESDWNWISMFMLLFLLLGFGLVPYTKIDQALIHVYGWHLVNVKGFYDWTRIVARNNCLQHLALSLSLSSASLLPIPSNLSKLKWQCLSLSSAQPHSMMRFPLRIHNNRTARIKCDRTRMCIKNLIDAQWICINRFVCKFIAHGKTFPSFKGQ